MPTQFLVSRLATRTAWSGFAVSVLAASAVIFVVLSAGWIWADPQLWTNHPSDAVLIERFNHKRAAFDELHMMFLADSSLGRIAPNFTRPANFFSGRPQAETPPLLPKRRARYRELFRDLGLKAGVEGYDGKEQVFFHASTRGLGISGSSKGYAFCRSTPQIVVVDLDSYRPRGVRSFTAFRSIGQNWYLYFEFEG
jgi:hypothetical protein